MYMPQGSFEPAAATIIGQSADANEVEVGDLHSAAGAAVELDGDAEEVEDDVDEEEDQYPLPDGEEDDRQTMATTSMAPPRPSEGGVGGLILEGTSEEERLAFLRGRESPSSTSTATSTTTASPTPTTASHEGSRESSVASLNEAIDPVETQVRHLGLLSS